MTKVSWLTPEWNIFEMEAYGPVVSPKENFEPIFCFIWLHNRLSHRQLKDLSYINMFLLSRPVVESDSAVESRPTLQPYRCHARQASLSFTIFQSLLKLMSIESVMPSNHLIFCHLLLLLPSIFPSIRVFSNELALCIRWPKYWHFSFSVRPFNNIEDWFPLGSTGLISLQSKGLSRVFSSTTIWKHQFFVAQPSSWSNSHIMTTGKP